MRLPFASGLTAEAARFQWRLLVVLALVVLATPHFTVTDTEGRYRLEGLPAGTYRLKTWLDSQTTLERTVQLAADTVLQLDLP